MMFSKLPNPEKALLVRLITGILRDCGFNSSADALEKEVEKKLKVNLEDYIGPNEALIEHLYKILRPILVNYDGTSESLRNCVYEASDSNL